MLAEEFAASRTRQWAVLRDYLAAYAAHAPVRSVAVVGNAPLEPDARRAAEIDAADLVIRANSLVLDEPGQPPTVGTACHAVVLSYSTRTTKWVFQNYRERAYLVPQFGFPRYFTARAVPRFWPADLGSVPIPNNIVKTALADRLDPDHVPGELTPTTGTAAVFLAHELFPDADLLTTGFSFLDGAERAEWAHHAGGTTEVNRFHDLAREAALLRSWIDDGSMRFLD